MDVKEKLVKLLENHCAVIGEDHCKASQSGECATRDCAICLASDLIANGVTVQEWIPVTERLPDKDGEYVVCIAKRNPFSRFMPMVARIEKNGWVNTITEQYIAEVTHWMPIPSTEGLE